MAGIRILLPVFFLLLATACVPPASPPTLIRFGLSVAPVTLDPRYATDAESYRLCRLLYRSLTDFHGDYRPRPALADWRQMGPRHYRFTLGDTGRRFHNGAWLDSDDVKATYEAILHGVPLSAHRGALQGIATIRLPDQDTVDFILHAPDPLFPGKLGIGILPAELIRAGHPFAEQPVGSGALRFLGWPMPEALDLERVRDGRRIRFVVVRDPAVRLMKLLRGELDLLQDNLPPELLDWTSRQSGVHIRHSPGNTFSYLGFNLADHQVGDQDVRRAVAHAVDREAIVRHVFQGLAHPAEAILVPGHWAAAADLPPHYHDPERARDYLQRYRQRNNLPATTPIRLVYKTSNNPFRLRLATIIQYQLRQVGIDLDIRSYDWGTFYGDIKRGDFQLYSLSWVGIKSPDIFRYAFHSEQQPPRGANRGRLHSPEADALIEAGEAATELQARTEIYRRLQGLLHEQLVYVPLWHENRYAVVRTGITGYTLHPDGRYDSVLQVDRLQ